MQRYMRGPHGATGLPRRCWTTAAASAARGLRLVQLCAFDRASPEFRVRLAREAELVRGHESTREANAFLAELWDERLDDGSRVSPSAAAWPQAPP